MLDVGTQRGPSLRGTFPAQPPRVVGIPNDARAVTVTVEQLEQRWRGGKRIVCFDENVGAPSVGRALGAPPLEDFDRVLKILVDERLSPCATAENTQIRGAEFLGQTRKSQQGVASRLVVSDQLERGAEDARGLGCGLQKIARRGTPAWGCGEIRGKVRRIFQRPQFQTVDVITLGQLNHAREIKPGAAHGGVAGQKLPLRRGRFAVRLSDHKCRG